jgi:hypothetical protein
MNRRLSLDNRIIELSAASIRQDARSGAASVDLVLGESK